jgi:hypothetical protein
MGVEAMPHLAKAATGLGLLGSAAAHARASGDIVAEEHALRAILEIDSRNLAALLSLGEVLAVQGDRRAAHGHFTMALKVAASAPAVPVSLHSRLADARSFVARIRSELSEEMESRLQTAGIRRGSISPRVADSLDLLFGRTPLYVQQPNMFYFPGLAQRPFFEREEFKWIDEFEAATSAIRCELDALIDGDDAFSAHTVINPRLPPPNTPLLNDPNWSACHLWQRGRELTEHTSRVPATVAALAIPPIPRIGGFAPMIMFSLLRPGTHIAPHHGVTNTRLICHLPLMTSSDCAIRVAAEARPFEVGKTLIFDDSFEHEAWNRGPANRVVLLFEIWRPDIGEGERAELSTLFELVELGEGEDAYA